MPFTRHVLCCIYVVLRRRYQYTMPEQCNVTQVKCQRVYMTLHHAATDLVELLHNAYMYE